MRDLGRPEGDDLIGWLVTHWDGLCPQAPFQGVGYNERAGTCRWDREAAASLQAKEPAEAGEAVAGMRRPRPRPYHLFGVFGGFNPDAVGRVELFRGFIPARRGGGLSSFLEVTQHDGLQGAGTSPAVTLLGVGITDRGRFAGGRAGWPLAGRRSHTDAALGRLLGRDLPYAS